ncbi:MAG: ester cyclase [Anaerolineales bacterium]
MDIEHNKAIVSRYLTEGPTNEELALSSLTDDAVYYDSGAPPSVGHEGQKRRTTALLTAFPDPKFDLDDVIAEGDKVVVRWTFHGTHSGLFGPFPATGKSLLMRVLDDPSCGGDRVNAFNSRRWNWVQP